MTQFQALANKDAGFVFEVFFVIKTRRRPRTSIRMVSTSKLQARTGGCDEEEEDSETENGKG